MDNFSYTSSYPESGDSSPRSREIDDQTQSFEEHPAQPAAVKAKFLCSYGGRIQPRPHDNHLSYVGGDTKILSVDRHARLPSLISRLAALSGTDPLDVCLKYQLPGEDLDALVSVTDDEDLSHLMAEYDRLSKSSPRPARLRLFIFRSKPSGNPVTGAGDVKPDQQWFVDALNSPPPAINPPPAGAGNPDYLFGLETPREVVGSDSGSDDPQVAAKKEEPVLMGNPNANPTFNKPVQEIPVPVQAGYFQERHVAPGGFAEPPPQQQQQQVYLVAAPGPAGVYPGQIGHYYGMPAAVYNPVSFHAPPPKANFVQVGLDSAGRQVYYTAAPPYQVVAAAPDGRSPEGAGGAVPTQASTV